MTNQADCTLLPVHVYSQDETLGRLGQGNCQPFCGNMFPGHLTQKDGNQATYHLHCPYTLCRDVLIFISKTALLTADRSVEVCGVTQSYPLDITVNTGT